MRHAVIVGTDKYPQCPLSGCVHDATDVAECLSLEQYGFDCKLLIDETATRSNILETISELAYVEEGPAAREFLVIYFAGHGQVLGNSGHLITIDGKPYDPGISLAHLAQLMESASKIYSHALAVLDCCHSGSAFTWTNSRPIMAEDIDREVSGINESRCVLAACRPEETAKENGVPAQGVFTRSLVEGLLGDAVDFSGNVSLLNLYEYVSKSIPASLQVPVFKGDVAGTVILGSGFEARKGPPIPVSEIQRNIAKAAAFADEYASLEQRELFADRSHRLERGALKCAQQLEPRLAWFQDTRRRLPDIERREEWKKLSERFDAFRRNLTVVEENQVIAGGRVVATLGRGGYGTVFRVDQENGEPWALKVFHNDHLDDEIMVQRFRNGYLGMKRLEHPRIVRVRELIVAPYAFGMDYIEGKNLRRHGLDREDSEACIRLLLDIAEVVEHAHVNGVKHRDIKPENIIIHVNEAMVAEPYLTDFDLAYHETNRTITTNAGVGGVINYAAPEQLHEPNAASARAETVDIYSMGQLLFYVVTGKDPSSHDFDRNRKTLLRHLNEWVEERASTILMDLYVASTKRKPSERPGTMVEFAAALSSAETYILASSVNDNLEEERFCERVARLYAGLGKYSSTGRTARCNSLSGQLELIVRLAEMHLKKGVEVGQIEIEFSVVGNFPVSNYKSGVSGRMALNTRLDRALKRFPRASRHFGSSGRYQVFVRVSDVPMTVQGAAEVHEVILTAVSAIESL
ncbi:protein kinase domain-containing protein [Amycolatopsis dongchuanensis]|uniref:non-specific serine/threonine protein kinase n=1 Tax=Amycolatopsis dongchuanensis TaxID=1070866 RepID=A0ABP8VLQ0_9PSEU